jgi:hypothetical protein
MTSNVVFRQEAERRFTTTPAAVDAAADALIQKAKAAHEARRARRSDGDEPNAERARKDMIKRSTDASSKKPHRIDRARTRTSGLPDHPPVEQAKANQHAPPANTSAGLDARKRAQCDSPKRSGGGRRS